MKDASTTARPEDLEAAEVDLVELALGGSVDLRSCSRRWLEAVGAARASAGERLVAIDDWLACALPAESAGELLRRTLLRDPLYRLHVDLLLMEVVAAVAAAARWRRLEEILFGDLLAIAPRIAGLLKLAHREGRSWRDARWADFDPLPPDVAARLDERCWGAVGSAESVFPLLHALYPALASIPVYLDGDDPFVAAVVVAATNGDAVRLSPDREEDIVARSRRGVPLWWRSLDDGSLEVTLATACRTAGQPEPLATQPFSRGVPDSVRAGSAVLSSNSEANHVLFWECVESARHALAFVGSGILEWPSDTDAVRRGLPHRSQLSDLVRSRRPQHGASDPPDEALRSLSDHPLYGLWLQLLLVEALDRELGEETVLLAPPTHAVVADIEGATHVYYRPRSDEENRRRPALDLGLVDAVLTRVASGLGFASVGVLGGATGPWSMGLALLAQVGVAQTKHDRWALSTHALDRLHGGGLMTGVIRRGRVFRERIHDVLEGLWGDRLDSAQEARCA